MHTYRVHVGYTRAGRDRWRKFATLADASAFCDAVMRRTGVILSIEQVKPIASGPEYASSETAYGRTVGYSFALKVF